MHMRSRRIVSARSNTSRKTNSGLSLVELLVTFLIMSLVMASIMGLVFTNASVSRKLNNKLDAIDSARQTFERIGRDMRQARSVGDIYGSMDKSKGYTVSSDTAAGRFPAANDPIWSSAGAPAGWSGAWPCVMNATNMIVQIPTFDNNGFPTAIPPNVGSPPQTTAQDNVETHIYRILADPDAINHPGEFRLEFWRFPAANTTTGAALGPPVGPIILLTGITGPTATPVVSPTLSDLRIFQLVDKTNPNAAPVDPSSVAAIDLARYTGLVVNLEIKKFNHSNANLVKTANAHYSIIPFKTEVFMRNNVLATSTSQPTLSP